MECSLPSSSAHGIRQVRMIEWVATPSSRGILLTQGLNLGLLHGRQIFYHLIHHQLLEFTQTHVHRVSDAIQQSHPLSSPSPPAFSVSQPQGLFK